MVHSPRKVPRATSKRMPPVSELTDNASKWRFSNDDLMNDPQQQDGRRTLIAVLLRGVALAILCAAVVLGWRIYSSARFAEQVAEDAAEKRGREPVADHAAAKPPSAATTSSPDAGSGSPPHRPVTDHAAESELRGLIVGTWQDDYQGRRTMTLRPDGTGTMVVELQGINATLFASRLTFHMEWILQDRRLRKRTVGGEPAVKVRAVLAMMGDTVEEEIVELTTDRLLVKEIASEKRFDWRRAPGSVERSRDQDGGAVSRSE